MRHQDEFISVCGQCGARIYVRLLAERIEANAGAAHHPGWYWYHNIRVHPDAVAVEIAGRPRGPTTSGRGGLNARTMAQR